MKDQEQKPTNVVFMGMGEPLLNWDAVDAALTILNHPDGLGIGARHITVSTVGILPNLARFAKRPEQFRLALSLHAPAAGLRRELMPIERKYALPEVMKALVQFTRRVTLEYVLIAGVNDSLETADQLAKLARPLGALVNLLPLHPGGAPDLTPSSHAQMMAFEQAHLVLRQPELLAPRIKVADAREQTLVERDPRPMPGELGRVVAGDRFERFVGIARIEIGEHPAHPLEQPPASLQRFDGVGEARRPHSVGDR